jgi:hypothetical protein
VVHLAASRGLPCPGMGLPLLWRCAWSSRRTHTLSPDHPRRDAQPFEPVGAPGGRRTRARASRSGPARAGRGDRVEISPRCPGVLDDYATRSGYLMTPVVWGGQARSRPRRNGRGGRGPQHPAGRLHVPPRLLKIPGSPTARCSSFRCWPDGQRPHRRSSTSSARLRCTAWPPGGAYEQPVSPK